MFKIKYILIPCIIAAVCAIYIIYYPDFTKAMNKANNEIPKNYSNSLTREFNTKIQQALNNLKTTTLQEWFDNLNKKDTIKIDKNQYYFFVYESLSSINDTFQLRVHNDSKFVDMMWSDVYENQKNNYVFLKEQTNEQLIEDMYAAASLNKDSQNPALIRYYWTDPIKNELTLKESVIRIWKKGDKTGIIGMGYTVNELSDVKKIKYKDFINSKVSFVYLLITAVVTIFILNRSVFMAMIFLALGLSTFLVYAESAEFIGSAASENIKTENMNRKLLSISFLIGVNIFILKTMESKYTLNEFSDTAVLFSFSIIVLLFSIFTYPSSSNVTNLMSERISEQLIFNLSVILNIFIIFTYFAHVIWTKQIWKRFLS